jgi:D-inositol-3-phosphate glycosyltransferase
MGDRPAPLKVTQALYFFPRGGSAQVTRYLALALTCHRVQTRVLSGSLGKPGESWHAETFFEPLDVTAVDYTPAMRAAEHGEDALLQDVPLHPSYEDRAGVADRIFTSVAPETGAHLEARWASLLKSMPPERPDVAHLHHLSPMQPAFRLRWPDIPMIGHIHGTELKMLKGVQSRLEITSLLGLDLEQDADIVENVVKTRVDLLDDTQRDLALNTRWPCWRYARYWEERLHQYAAMCDRLIVLTPDARDQAAELLNFDPELIHPVPNGVDIDRFSPDRLSPDERLARWRKWLVEEPQGWDESGVPGSVRYSRSDVDEWFQDVSGDRTPVLFFVGRFMSMKRVPLLIRAYKKAQSSFNWRAPLVIWGGNPGEWEDEHPVTVARDEGPDGVFFVGWRGHDELPEGLNAADVMVAPSINEPFGQVYLEAMACELPVIGTLSGGPPSFINRKDGDPDGWLVPPDDEAALAAALIKAVNNPEERRQRGRSALESVRAGYSWEQVAGQVRDIYDDLLKNS